MGIFERTTENVHTVTTAEERPVMVPLLVTRPVTAPQNVSGQTLLLASVESPAASSNPPLNLIQATEDHSVKHSADVVLQYHGDSADS